ncbi:MAG: hypothetical protein KAX38_01495, partial [Candidatus Krumholzibacteria bacterium]|nr:hypothetical protein [Candidatus Krumholzibacteria bacterium]
LGDGRRVKRALFGFFLLVILTAFSAPYLYTIISLGGGECGLALNFNGIFLWTVLAAGILPVFLLILRLRRDRLNKEGEIFIVVMIGAVLLLGSFAPMPRWNIDKFVYLVFLSLIVLAGDAVPLLTRLFSRALNRAFLVFLAAGAIVTVSLGLAGYILDRGGDVPVVVGGGKVFLTEHEKEGYRWIRKNTPYESIFINSRRSDILVLGARRQLWTDCSYAVTWRYGDELIEWREEIVDDLYSGRPVYDDRWGKLFSIGLPVYLVFRPEDRDLGGYDFVRSTPSERYREVFSNEEFFIVEILK